MKKKNTVVIVEGIVVFLIILMIAAIAIDDADAHYVANCKKGPCKLHVIKPFKQSFLGPVGACESGTGSHRLRVGLRVHSPSGQYHGRYQFGLPDWKGASGKGDPHNAGWLEQAYRAVVWLHRNGRDSWPNC